MVDDRAAHLQAEINRIAAALNAEPIRVGDLLKNDDRNVYMDDDGRYHYDYWERGKQRVDHVGDIDEVLYWFAKDTAFQIGSLYAAHHTPSGEEYRAVMFAKEYELLNQLNPRWARRGVRETANDLRRWGKDDDVKLLPDIPERNG
jgi:Immunity protein 63